MSRITTRHVAGWRLATLAEVATFKNDSEHQYLPIRRELLDLVRPGHYVKLCVVATNHEKLCAETLWARVNRRKGRFFHGTVASAMKRTVFHKMKILQEIEFSTKHIINLRTQDLTEEWLRSILNS